MKIALDVMGGDFAPANNMEGAKLALAQLDNISKLLLVGNEEVIRKSMQDLGINDPRVEVVHASQVIDMKDHATDALRAKKDSSITVAVELVKKGAAQGVFSPGHTGASVSAATIRLGRLEGVDRPGIASPIPNDHCVCNLLDAGANPQALSDHLFQYAVMGHIYAKQVYKRESPIIGLLSIGEEDEKGTDLTRAVFAMLKATNLNFKGNVEGRDLFGTPLDVAVCDGFVGNIVLKSCEGTAKAMQGWIKSEIMKSGIIGKIAALLLKPAFQRVKQRGSYETYGGSPLLGLRGNIVIGHGSSSPIAVCNGIRACCHAIENNVNPLIEEALAQYT